MLVYAACLAVHYYMKMNNVLIRFFVHDIWFRHLAHSHIFFQLFAKNLWTLEYMVQNFDCHFCGMKLSLFLLLLKFGRKPQ